MRLSEHMVRAALRIAARLYYRSSDQADWIFEKVRRPGSLWIVARNILNYQRGIPRVAGIVTLGIEPVFGCNLRCAYCWGQLEPTLKGKRPPLMDWDLFTTVVDQAPRSVESMTLACLGEPLMHPRIADMIAYVAQSGRRACMYTNGTLLEGERLEKLAAAPLSTLNISIEPDPETSREFRGVDYGRVLDNVRAYAAARRHPTEIQLSVVLHPGNTDRLEPLRRDWEGLADRIKVSPLVLYDGCEIHGSCSEVWRGNLTVLSDGAVTPCCFDVHGDLAVGNIGTESLGDIIRGPRLARMLENFARGRLPKRCLQCAEVNTDAGPVRIPKRPAKPKPSPESRAGSA